jgi:hypothetical protein
MPKRQSWTEWTKWNQSLEQTLTDAQRQTAGELSVAEFRRKAGGPTHSIVDVEALANCWVLSTDELHHHFGSKRPSRKAIEGGAESFVAQLEPGKTVVITAFDRHQPCAVLFAATSLQ